MIANYCSNHSRGKVFVKVRPHSVSDNHLCTFQALPNLCVHAGSLATHTIKHPAQQCTKHIPRYVGDTLLRSRCHPKPLQQPQVCSNHSAGYNRSRTGIQTQHTAHMRHTGHMSAQMPQEHMLSTHVKDRRAKYSAGRALIVVGCCSLGSSTNRHTVAGVGRQADTHPAASAALLHAFQNHTGTDITHTEHCQTTHAARAHQSCCTQTNTQNTPTHTATTHGSCQHTSCCHNTLAVSLRNTKKQGN